MPKKRVKPTPALLEAQSKRISAKPRSKKPLPAPKTRAERMPMVAMLEAVETFNVDDPEHWGDVELISPPSRWSRLWAWLDGFRWGRP